MSPNSTTLKKPTSLKMRISKNNDIFKEDDKINNELNNMKDEIKELREEISITRNEIIKAMGDLKKVMDKPKDIECIKKKVYKNIKNWLDIEYDQENTSSSDKKLEETKQPAITSVNIPEEAQKDDNNISETGLQSSNDAQTEKGRPTKTNSDTNQYNEKIKEIVIIDEPSTADDSSDKSRLSTYTSPISNRRCIPISMIGVKRNHWNSMNTHQQPRQGILTEAQAPTQSEKSEGSRKEGNTSSSNKKLQETTGALARSATILDKHDNNISKTILVTRNDDVTNKKRLHTQTNSVISPDNNEKRRKMEMTSSNNEATRAFITEYERTKRGRYQDLKHFFDEKVSMGKLYNLSDENVCKVLAETMNHPFLEQQLMQCQNLNKLEGLLDKLIEHQCKKCGSYRHLTSECSKCDFCKAYGHKIDKCYILTQRDREQRKHC